MDELDPLLETLLSAVAKEVDTHVRRIVELLGFNPITVRRYEVTRDDLTAEMEIVARRALDEARDEVRFDPHERPTSPPYRERKETPLIPEETLQKLRNSDD